MLFFAKQRLLAEKKCILRKAASVSSQLRSQFSKKNTALVRAVPWFKSC